MRSKNDASSKLVSDRHTAIYARDGAVQPSGSNLEAQVEACVRQVAEDRVPAVDAAYVFRDQQSGAELDRPGLHELRRAMQAGEVSLVYVVAPSRLSRKLRHLALLGQEFSAAGVEVRVAKDFNGKTCHSRAFPGADTGVYGCDYNKVKPVPTSDEGSSPPEAPDSAAEQHSEGALAPKARDVLGLHKAAALAFQAEMGERVRRGKAELAELGYMPVGTGHGVYGYDLKLGERRRVVNEVEAQVVLRVFTEFDGGVKVSEIVRRLNEEGVPSKRGMRWGNAVVLNMLGNESYLGVDYYGKTRTVRGPDGAAAKVTAARSEWIRITGFSPPLVLEELFWRVQTRLWEWRTRPPKVGGKRTRRTPGKP